MPLSEALGVPLRDLVRRDLIDPKTGTVQGYVDYLPPGFGGEEADMQVLANTLLASDSGVRKAAKTAPTSLSMEISAPASSLERLGAALPDFTETLTALLREGARSGDLASLREVTAYAKGLLARGGSGGRQRRKPA